MTLPADATGIEHRLQRALQLQQSGQVLQAELLYLGVLKDCPTNAAAATRVAQLALQRGDAARAVLFLEQAIRSDPANAPAAVDLSVALVATEQPGRAILVLESALARTPSFPPGWLLLGQLRDASGDPLGALKAWYQAITRAQRAGQWNDEGSTPPQLLSVVVNAIDRLRRGRRELFFDAFEDLRQEVGSDELSRVDRALTGFLAEWDATPPDARQRPKFLFFPDLPTTPYLDPQLQPWAPRLEQAFQAIREEALRTLDEDQRFPNFIDLQDGASMENYVGAEGPQAAWEAFFFYRRGERFDGNHARCPRTSAVLESIELCRIADQAPEICFSVLKPGTHIKPHYGVTNVRTVVHLPLLVPPHCALNLIDAGEHHWQEGRLMMFDDTFQHEAWNRSTSLRVVLLMDCWNPHLTEVEKRATTRLIETISGLQMANRPPRSSPPPGGGKRPA